MKSVERPVFCVEPCPKLVVMPATFTPRPTWAGFVPPRSAVGAPPLLSTWDRVSSKTVWLALKPTVLTLAMLLPVTSSLVWWARRPLIAENMERSMGRSSSGCGRPSWGPSGGEAGLPWRPARDVGRAGSARRDADLGEPAERDGDSADDGRGLLVAGEADRADRAGDRGAVLGGVADLVADQRAGAERALQGEQLGVLGGQLLQLLDLGERRRLRHELGRARRVAGVLVAHLRDQQLQEHVLVHLVGAGHRRRRGRGAGQPADGIGHGRSTPLRPGRPGRTRW